MPAVAESAGDSAFTAAEVPAILRLARVRDHRLVTKRDVDKLIDQHIVPKPYAFVKNSKRWLRTRAIHVAAAEFDLRRELPIPAVRHQGLRDYLRFGMSELWVSDNVRINLKGSIGRVDAAIQRYKRLMGMVVVDPDVQRGEPVIRGTRITAYTIAEIARQGAATDEILHDYPTLDAEKIEAACLYADAHPRRGRPVLPKGAKEVFRISADEINSRWPERR